MKFLKLTVVLFIAISMFSCRVAYFKEGVEKLPEQITQSAEPIIKNGDLLSIVVAADDPTLANQFNLQASKTANYGELSSQTGGSGQGVLVPYMVETDGAINMPVLGKVVVSGLTRVQVMELLQNKLSAYVNKPIVTIQFLNYKISVLGEVQNPGTFVITDEKITIPQALGLAGDLTINGKRGNVLLVREKNDGQKEFVRVDLHNKDFLFSEYYYLKQNDIIYVEPSGTKVLSSNIAIVTIPLSLVSTAISITTMVMVATNTPKK
ncbi:MAG: polysaccharide biosynthesis/export family protein [Prevotellaceae bacterium]|jgi:polysaccharide export outer membrane protein|nr:polysaccharide biosynthesis/export family protein [Prevotellaceae bacterium]